MLPVGPLMIEHRLIEKMIRLIDQEAARIRDNISVGPEFAFVDVRFLDTAIGFIRTYADQVHHGKEEDILFAALQHKPLSLEHQQIMQELKEDHVWGRQTTASLTAAKDRFIQGETESLSEILALLSALVEFYPRHIEKEDKHFFLPVMEYFSPAEKEALQVQMQEFDQGFIHTKYQKLVADWGATGCKCHL